MKWPADRERTWGEILARLRREPADSDLRILILAAHPDDETIGASLLLSRSRKSSVAFLTDGAPRDTRLWPPGMNGSREDYANLRRREATSVMSITGISQDAIAWLGGVDQEAVFEIDRLIDQFRNLLVRTNVDLVVTHPYEGGHPDHDAAAVVARIAASLSENPPALLEMTSYHACDGRCVTGEFLNSDESLTTSFDLSIGDRERKRRMLDSYASQRLVLENFPIHNEPLRFAPEYDFSKPPHEGRLWYECMGWAMTGPRWRELASAALNKYQEQPCR